MSDPQINTAPPAPLLPSAPSTPATQPPASLAMPPVQASQEATLHVIHIPTEVSGWPPAPGWWGLLTLVILLLGALWGWRRYQRQGFRREALQLLTHISQQSDLTAPQRIDALSALLKRVAMTAHGREAVAGLSGDQWLHFLDETGNTQGFSQGPGRALGLNRFQPQPALDAPALLALCRDWIQKQRC